MQQSPLIVFNWALFFRGSLPPLTDLSNYIEYFFLNNMKMFEVSLPF